MIWTPTASPPEPCRGACLRGAPARRCVPRSPATSPARARAVPGARAECRARAGPRGPCPARARGPVPSAVPRAGPVPGHVPGAHLPCRNPRARRPRPPSRGRTVAQGPLLDGAALVGQVALEDHEPRLRVRERGLGGLDEAGGREAAGVVGRRARLLRRGGRGRRGHGVDGGGRLLRRAVSSEDPAARP